MKTFRANPVTVRGQAFGYRRAYSPDYPLPALPGGVTRRLSKYAGWTIDEFATEGADPLTVTTYNYTRTPVKIALAAGTPAKFVMPLSEANLPSGSIRDAFFDSCQADGGDIRVFEDEDCTERCAFGLTAFNKTAKTFRGEVRLPSAIAQNAYFYLRTGPGGPSALVQPATDEFYGHDEVWRDFEFAMKDGLRDLAKAMPVRRQAGGTEAAIYGETARTFSGGVSGDRIETSQVAHAGSRSYHGIFKANAANQGRFFSKGIYERLEYTAGAWRTGREATDGGASWSHAGGGAPTSYAHAVLIYADDITAAPTLVARGVEYTMTAGTAKSGALYVDPNRLTIAARDQNGAANLDGGVARFGSRTPAVTVAYAQAEFAALSAPASVAVAEASSTFAANYAASQLPALPIFFNGEVRRPVEATMSGLHIATLTAADLVAHHDLCPHLHNGSWSPFDPDNFTVKSGRWEDPTTWNTGTVPGADDTVVILKEHRVVVGAPGIGTINAPLYMICVEGMLQFDPGASHLGIYAHTIMGDETSVWAIGLGPAEPHLGTIDMAFPAGLIDIADDPRLLTKGIMWMGQRYWYLPAKTHEAMMSTAGAAPGATFAQMDAAIPATWAVGDLIALPAVDVRASTVAPSMGFIFGPDDPGNDTEFRTITSLDRTLNRVHWSGGLLYDHRPTPNVPSSLTWNGGTIDPRKLPIGNFTRNMTVRSLQTGTTHDQVKERAHDMQMFSDRCEIVGVAYEHMGRTDKRVQNVVIAAHISGAPGVPAIGPLTATSDILGRYALHFHGCGASNGRRTIKVEDCSFRAMAGIGLVSHSSTVDPKRIVSADSYGAHYMTEAGDEEDEAEDWTCFGHENAVNDFTHKGQQSEFRHDWGRCSFFQLQARRTKLRRCKFYGATRGKPVVYQVRGAYVQNAWPGNWTYPELSNYSFWSPDGVDHDLYSRTDMGSRVAFDVSPLDVQDILSFATFGGIHVVKHQNIAGHNRMTHLKNIHSINSFVGHHSEYTASYAWQDISAYRTALRSGADEHGYHHPTAVGLDWSKEAMAQFLLRGHFDGFKYAIGIDGDPAAPLVAGESWQYFIGDATSANLGASFIRYDATGTFAQRSAHDSAAQGFKYLSTNGDAGATTTLPSIFHKLPTGWTPAVPFSQFTTAGLPATPTTLVFDDAQNWYSEASQRVNAFFGTRTDPLGTWPHPPAKEKRQQLNIQHVRGALKRFGYWRKPTGEYFVEFQHHWGEPTTLVDRLSTARVFLPLEPIAATGSNLAAGVQPAFAFNGVKA